VVRNGKRKDTDVDSDKSKKQLAGSSSFVVKAGEYYEGCGKQRHKRKSCQLTTHNEKGLWIQSEGYRIKKAWLDANGKGDDHPELRWYEYESNEGHRIQGRSKDRKDKDRAAEQPPRWQPARQSAPDVHGNKPATRRVEFEGVKDRDT
jgi:hypothetical protein